MDHDTLVIRLLSDNATASYTVAPNLGAPRTGNITVGGDVFTVTQSAPSCYFTLSSTSATLPVNGGTGTIGVTASAPSCAWTATPSNSAVTVTSGATGTGNGTVNYSVATNTAGPQTDTITIGNTTGNSVYTIQQDSAFTCTFTVSPTPVQIPANGSSWVFAVNASYPNCMWTATSNNPALTITGANSGTGSGGVYYAVATNTGGPRTLTITAGCVTFTVNQAGAQASNNPVPAITTLLPASVTAGSGAFTLTVDGSNFVSGATVNFNGAAVTTTFVSATQLTAAIPASAVATAGTASVTVTNPTPGGGTSNALTFTITAAGNNPLPAITTLSPASVTAGSGAFTLTVTGSSFVSDAVVNFNGTAVTTTFVSATQLTAAIPESDIAAAGTASITVTNPAPGGGTSNAATLTITASSTNPVPVITALQPTGVAAGSGAFTLMVTGSNFISSSVVNFNGSARSTTYVSATQLTAAITAADVAAVATVPITVTNPAPGGGTSAAINFTVTAAVAAPQATLSPTSLTFTAQQGTTSAAQPVTLSNTGGAALTITGITIAGSDPGDFGQTNTCGASLAAGTSCSISVTFSPASAAGASATLSIADNASDSPQTVNLTGTGTVAPTFTVTSSTPSQTIQSGGVAQYAISVSAQNGTFPGTVSLAVSGLPTGAIATFTPPTLTPGSTSATSQLSIQTGAQTATDGISTFWPLVLTVAPLFGLFFPMGKRRRRWIILAVLLISSVGAVAALTGCGGGFGFSGQTYTLTITATSGAEQQSTTVQLTVK